MSKNTLSPSDLLLSLLQNKTIDRYIETIREERTKIIDAVEQLLADTSKAKTFEEMDALIPRYRYIISAVGMLADKEKTTLIQTIAKEVVEVEKEEEVPTPPPEAKTITAVTKRYSTPLVKLTTKLPSMNGWQIHIYGTTEQASRQFLYTQDGFLNAYESYKRRAIDNKGRLYSRTLEQKFLNSFKLDWCYPLLGDVIFFISSETATLEHKVWEEMVYIVQRQWEAVLETVRSMTGVTPELPTEEEEEKKEVG